MLFSKMHEDFHAAFNENYPMLMQSLSDASPILGLKRIPKLTNKDVWGTGVQVSHCMNKEDKQVFVRSWFIWQSSMCNNRWQ